MIVTTSIGLEGYKVVQHLGVVRGLVVRSRSIFGNLAGGIQSLFGETSPSTPNSAKGPARMRLI